MCAGFAGVYGDRLFAFTSSENQKGFPYFTARDQRQMLRYQPRFRQPDKAARPINLTEAESLGPGVTAMSADATDLMIDVETPSGQAFAIDDPLLMETLRQGIDAKHQLKLARSDRPITDCR